MITLRVARFLVRANLPDDHDMHCTAESSQPIPHQRSASRSGAPCQAASYSCWTHSAFTNLF